MPVLVLAAIACGRAPKDPRLVVVRHEGDRTRLYVVGLSPKLRPRPALEDLPGDLHSPRAIDRGRGLLVLARRPGEPTSALWRVRVEPHGALERERQLAEAVPGRIVAVSPDGSALLLADRERAWLLRPGEALIELMQFRYFAGGDVSPDGTRVVLAGTPTSCAEPPLGACPMDLWAVQVGPGAPSSRPLVEGRRANYMPSFVPGTRGARVAYQTTARDDSPACAANVNDCRHDLMRVAWEGGAPELVREGPALGAVHAPDGRRLAYLSNAPVETGCRSVVCDSMSVYLLAVPDGREPTRLVTAGASNLPRHAWSTDGRWLAYTGRDRRSVEVVRVDGSARFAFEGTLDLAWIQ